MPVAVQNKMLTRAVEEGRLMESAAQNIQALLNGATDDLYARVVDELASAGAWNELNDRFYKTLAFGTGGLRGRTIGKIVTQAERGDAPNSESIREQSDFPPQFPCVGTNAMNFYNVARATRGLVAYLHEWLGKQTQSENPSPGGGAVRLSPRERVGVRATTRPKIVIAHDTRFFSREFTALAAKVAAENGADAFIFDGPRSTPELSFAVRHLRANAGIVITASHNPPHDNGYKVYFDDGAQVIEPHASGIIAKVNAIMDETYEACDPRGEVITLGREIDEAYMKRLESLVLDPELVRSARDLRIVFTPIHGTGGVIIKPMLERFGFHFSVVKEQDHFDGAFPTVKSPNPENAEALKLGAELAKKENADLVVATDPDCDRMGVAVRTANKSEPDGQMKLLTGNQIGSLMAYYRAKTLFDRGVLDKANASRGVIIKTFVTTDLQKAIAEHYGVRCVETLTGFKYIGAKLGKYERALPAEVRANYRDLSEDETRIVRLTSSSFYIFGGEESYGYSGADFVRDKDGNGATIMFCEVAAYAKSRKLTLDALLDEVFATFGYFEEKNGALTFEGAEGALKIKALLESYDTNPPNEMLGSPVVAVKNFEKETFRDVEGDVIPKEKMLIFELEDRTRVAVRGSGTEPKIKYYLFAQRRPQRGARLTAEELSAAKTKIDAHLERLWDWLQADAQQRALA